MRSLQIRDGDLVLGVGRRAALVYGKEKLLQDLRLWLLEPFGMGFTTKQWGSRLGEFVGGSNPELFQAEVESEIRRILTLYQAWQYERVQQAQYDGQTRNWSRSEILAEITEVSSQVFMDRIVVRVEIRTLAGNESILDFSIAPDEVTVS